MTKSPLAFTQQALAVARAALRPYSSKFSKKDFTRHQHVAILALKAFLKVGYRDVVEYLHDWSDLRTALELEKVPHFTTLQKFHARLKKKTSASSWRPRPLRQQSSNRPDRCAPPSMPPATTRVP
jgi:hypothetical protein